MTGIYKITSPSGKVYIGQSRNILKRWYSYKKSLKHSIGKKLLHSLLKYGFVNHNCEIIEILSNNISQNELNDREKFYILQQKVSGKILLNLTEGGEGSLGYKHTDEAKLKMKNSKKGKYKGKDNPNYGKGLFGENNPMYGFKRPEIGKRAKIYASKRVSQYTKTNVFIKQWSSISDAGEFLNIKIANISACALNKKNYKTAGGFIWKYE